MWVILTKLLNLQFERPTNVFISNGFCVDCFHKTNMSVTGANNQQFCVGSTIKYCITQYVCVCVITIS